VCSSRVLAQTRTMENVEKKLRAITLRKFFENVPNAWWKVQTPVVLFKGVWELASNRRRTRKFRRGHGRGQITVAPAEYVTRCRWWFLEAVPMCG
jgi:hypothetical protein